MLAMQILDLNPIQFLALGWGPDLLNYCPEYIGSWFCQASLSSDVRPCSSWEATGQSYHWVNFWFSHSRTLSMSVWFHTSEFHTNVFLYIWVVLPQFILLEDRMPTVSSPEWSFFSHHQSFRELQSRKGSRIYREWCYCECLITSSKSIMLNSTVGD